MLTAEREDGAVEAIEAVTILMPEMQRKASIKVGDLITMAGERVADGNPFPRELIVTQVV